MSVVGKGLVLNPKIPTALHHFYRTLCPQI